MIGIRMLASTGLLVFVSTGFAQDVGGAGVAQTTSAAATFAARTPGARDFRILPAGAELKSGDLLVTLPGASLESKNREVTLKSFADYDGISPLPILETAFTLHPVKDEDLSFTLDRGRVDLTSNKAEGAATVVVKFWDQTWTISLDDPGSRVALELCGRWPAGSRFRPQDPGKPGTAARPVASLVFLVLKGSATVRLGDVTLGMKAPPGPAILEWDSITGARPEPKKLEKLPVWADPDTVLSERGKKVADALERFRVARAEDPSAAVAKFLASKDPVEQHVALVTLGACDELGLLGKVLAEAKTLEEWDFGITVIRHWLGRSPGQDQKFYEGLIAIRGYDKNQARLIVQLLFGFSAEDLLIPETFDVMIEYLRNESPAIRNLAAWNMVRFVPQGKTIPYKPDGSKADAEACYQAWRKLIPSGALPPREEKND